MNIGIILGSIREERVNEDIAKWIKQVAENYEENIEFELVDLRDYQLSMFTEAISPAFRDELWTEDQQAWSDKITELDGYIFVTPEYNHSVTAALKNAFDYLSGEPNDKAAAIVSYGSAGGFYAANHLRTILSEFQIAHVTAMPSLYLDLDWQDDEFKPRDAQKDSVETMIYQLSYWTEALKTVREKKEKDNVQDDSQNLD